MSCSFFIPFRESECVTLDEDKNKVTTFQLTENSDGLSMTADNLYFADQWIRPYDIKVKAENDMRVRVTEVSGKRTGWKLKVQLDSFKDEKNTKEMRGAQLFFPVVTPTTTTTGQASSKPPVICDDDISFVSGMKGTAVTVSSASEKVAYAQEGTGYGEWVIPYENDEKIQLKIPAIGQEVGEYVAELTYIIEDSPN